MGHTSRLDVATRTWWRAVGRPIDLAGAEAWLAAPTSPHSVVGDGWLTSYAGSVDGDVRDDVPGAGLVPDLSALDGPTFSAADVHPLVRDFYEHTSRWHMDAWSEWSPWAWPGGELISRLFGRRVGQLALPMRSLDVAKGMDSRVSVIAGADGRQIGAGWLRTLRSTGDYVFSGCYSTRRLPGAQQDSIHVAFPLEKGNVQVFLRPEVGEGGSLWLHSPGEEFGGHGAYVVVEQGGGVHASRAPIHETFHVYVDEHDVLRTDHDLRLWGAPVVRLHYRLAPSG